MKLEPKWFIQVVPARAERIHQAAGVSERREEETGVGWERRKGRSGGEREEGRDRGVNDVLPLLDQFQRSTELAGSFDFPQQQRHDVTKTLLPNVYFMVSRCLFEHNRRGKRIAMKLATAAEVLTKAAIWLMLSDWLPRFIISGRFSSSHKGCSKNSADKHQLCAFIRACVCEHKPALVVCVIANTGDISWLNPVKAEISVTTLCTTHSVHCVWAAGLPWTGMCPERPLIPLTLWSPVASHLIQGFTGKPVLPHWHV